MKKALGIIFLFLSHLTIFSQADKNFQVQSFKSDQYSQTVSLFVKADKQLLQQYLKSHNGIYKYASGGYHGITISSSEVKNLLSQSFVQGSDFTLHRPVALNDTMRVRDNVNPVHNGTSPLDTSYSGKGVLVGFIDTGVDFNHPDFKDVNGNTRIIRLWDQSLPFDTLNSPAFYGYGQIWDSTEINNGLCTSVDGGGGHGTTVTGTACGNGMANGRHKGVAPESSIIMVRSDFNAGNWLGTVADAVDYIFKMADTLQMPVVINASVGDYFGSHDGTDPAAVFIDSLIDAKPGRLMVCAAGNSGNIGTYHVRHDAASLDTNFTWFKYNPTSALGYGAVFFEGYADTLDLQNVYYSVGANLPSGSFADRGQTSFVNVLDHVGTVYSEPIINNGNVIANVDFYAEKQGPVYLLQIHIQEPDSNTYNFRFTTTGTGNIDIWSTSVFGTSPMVNFGIPSSAVLPEIVDYISPDSSKIIVSSFSCGQNTLLVGNYYAMQTYTDYNGNTQILGGTNGSISVNSSRGPSRDNRVKPEIAASGDVHMSAGPMDMLPLLIANEPHKVDQGGMHMRNGGTSMACPVVTGIAALALEKCPNLTADEFRNMMTNSAKTDAFTGVVPNMSYGYGKADAFAALVESNFIMGVALNTSLCPGDSVELLIGPGPLYDFLWSTGDTTSTIWATDSAYFSVEAHNQFGCKGRIDSILTSVYPLNIPTITVDTTGGFLLSSQGLTYQWLFEGDTLVGETNNTLDFTSTGNGTYHVYITDMNGCETFGMLYLNIQGVEEMVSEEILLYPNPTTGLIQISSAQKIESVQVMDASGKLVFNASETYSVDLKDYERGIYFVKIRTENNSYSMKVVKE